MLELLEKDSKAVITTLFKMFKRLDETLNVFSEENL